MFGRLNHKTSEMGPVEITTTTEIAASAADFFNLIDFSNPQNAKIQLGHSVQQMRPELFELILNFLPDLVFELTVEDSIPNSRYCYVSPMPEGVGQLLWTRERFEIESTGADSCHVVVKTTGEFVIGLSDREQALEIATLTVACENALAKLKIHAEGGIEQVHEFEQSQAL